MAVTLGYSEMAQGWSTFYSFMPQEMAKLNNSFYSFSAGNIWIHDTNQVVGDFYAQGAAPGLVRLISNQNPLEKKLFKALGQDSSVAWSCASILTDDIVSSAISMDSSLFVRKEGMYFANIRNGSSAALNSDNQKNRSTIGVGVGVVAGTSPTKTITFASQDISSTISIGDFVYYAGFTQPPGTPPPPITINPLQAGGVLQAISGNTMTVGGSPLLPNGPFYICIVKNSIVESYGILGSYLDVTLTSPSGGQSADLFTLEIDYMKSYP